MSITTLMSKNWAFIVIALIIFGSFSPSISGYNNKTDYFESVNVQDETILKCYALGRYGVEETEITLSFEEAERVYNKLKELQVEMNLNPFSEKTHEAKVEYIDLLAEKNLIHHSLTKNDYLSLLTPQWHNQWKKIPINDLPSNGGIASSFICSVTSGGMGTLLPPFLLPRPRIGLSWIGRGMYDAAATAVGSLLLARGFMAIGEQTGIALGFTGVGLTYGSPVGPIYGLAGYALFVTVNAEYIETFPPNFPPEISDENPRTGSSNIPVSLSELSFRINDPNGDRMSYTVTTDPYIGSGSGNIKGNGVYTVPVSNLQGSTEYKWYVSVSDGQDTTEKTFSFTTILEEPVVSNPVPHDWEFTSVELSHLQFTLTDVQGDLMDYTVETSPYIGSGNASNVPDGTYTVPVQGLKGETWYNWYVNVTDGVHWTRKTFSFFTADLDDGLVGYWSFDEGNGNIAHDHSGNGNDGTIYGASWTINAVSGKALDFGGNDGVRINDDSSLDGFSKLTILAWAKPHSHEGGNMGYVVGKYEEHYAVHCPYRIWAYEGDWIVELGDGSDYYIARSPIIMDEQWYHLVLWWDGDELKLFVNGDETDSAPANTFLYNNNEYLRFGERVDDGFFNGVIDEVRIYDRALNENEIQELYTAH